MEVGKPLSVLLCKTKKSIDAEFDWVNASKHCDVKQRHSKFESLDIYSDIHPFWETAIWIDKPGKQPLTTACYINANRI